MIEAWQELKAALAALFAAITRSIRRDPRPWLTVYAVVVCAAFAWNLTH